MLRVTGAVLCAAMVPLLAAAQSSRVIAGGVYDDRAALAVRADFVPAPGVTVKLYHDGGDRIPSADDALMATDTTSAAGLYVFPAMPEGDYWVVVDSRSMQPAVAWAEQTFGPGGSLCARQNGITQTTYFEGACIGGRSFASDDASSIATSEHIALVSTKDPTSRIDFAFSFNVVTSTEEGDRIQGSLRQFVTNANAIAGPSRMRFVPLTAAPEQRHPVMGAPPQWWSIALTKPLPELRDEDTVIDGTAYHLLSPASILNTNPGRIGEAPTIRPQDRTTVPLTDKPELELTLNGAEGIVCAARCGLRSLALHGATTSVIMRGDARIEHVLIGASPDGAPESPTGTVGLQIEKGVTYARHVLVTTQQRAGIVVAKDARIDAERLDVNRCGDPQSGGGIVLLSDGSTIRTSIIAANPGAGIILGSLDGATPAHMNTIDSSTISGNQAGVLFGAGSSRNTITRNDIMWNRLGGVTSAPFESTPPRENRLSANRFDENGLRPIILDLGSTTPNELSQSAGSCTRNAAAPNNGISAPRLTNVRVQTDEATARVTIRGHACPGEIVEIYQSFVTSGIRDKEPELPRIRDENRDRETITNQEREMRLPSIGEFNYLGATNTSADGTFEASFPLPVITSASDVTAANTEETNIWASQVLQAASPSDRAFSAIAIDATGNTSEMSVRRQVD